MMRRVVLWLDDRLGTAGFVRTALRKAFPDHWSFMLGEIALYCFVTLLATGIFLGFFFDASAQRAAYEGPYAPLRGVMVSHAYASILRLSFEVKAGLLIRQIHHWAALVFLAAIVCHMARIFFTAAFRRPRELNWMIGMSLLMLAMAAGFTGYSLPDDSLSGTGLRIAYSVLLSVPAVGLWAALLIFGGAFPAAALISRLFFLHVLLIPALIALALTVHLAVVWRQKHSQFSGPGRTERNVVGSPLWPAYALKSVGLAFAVVAVLAGLGAFAQINPVWTYGPYNAWEVSSPAQPDWYVGWLEGALRLGPAWGIQIGGREIPPPFFAGVALPLAFFALIFAWPFLERMATHDHRDHQLLDSPLDAPLRTACGVAILTFAAVLTFAGSNDVQAVLFHMPVETLTAIYRVALVAAPIAFGAAAYVVVAELKRRRDRGVGPPKLVTFRRTEEGGFQAASVPEAPKAPVKRP
jgi:quinol---cytochrome-c reductase cytochrome b subunit